MVPAITSEIQHRGRRYRVQTEDLGGASRALLTLVYDAGTPVARIEAPYAEIVGPQASSEQIRAFMEARHRQAVADLLADRLAAGSPQARTLEDLIAETLPTVAEGAAGGGGGEGGPTA